MSAAVKLERLWRDDDPIAAIIALPEIIAVVKAAEEYAEDGDRMYATEHERKTHAALSALDEKLGDAT